MIIINKTTAFRLLAAVSLLVILAFPLSAQEQEDSVFTFRFFSGRDMFYVPVLNNGVELNSLFDIVDLYKDRISDNQVKVRVDGFFISEGDKAEKRKTAKTRSNRVKSELIVKKGLKEDHFQTQNQPGSSNYVTVRFFDIINNVVLNATEPTQSADTIPADTIPFEPIIEPVEEVVNEDTIVVVPQIEESIAEVEAVAEVDSSMFVTPQSWVWTDSRYALKTNLLFYAILMPNLEFEWKVADRWSVALEAQGAWYGKENPHKIYKVATLLAEGRYWPIERSRWHGMYVGVFGGPGLYDWCNGKKNGHLGEGGMVGVSAGYMWPISHYLSLEAGIGVGYMRLRDKEYRPFDGHFIYQRTRNINYFGPLRAKLSLVWRFQCKKINSVK